RLYGPEFTSIQQEKICIQSVRMLLDNQKDFESDVLYIGYTSQLSEKISTISLINLICILDIPISDKLKSNANVNMILFNKSFDLASVFNKIYDLLTEDDLRLNDYMVKLFDSLSQGKGLQNIVDIGYEMLGNPLHVIDLSWKHIASSKDPVIDDIVWQEFITTGYQSVTSVSHYLNSNFTYKLLNSPEPYFWKDNYAKYGRLMSRITIGNKPIAVAGALDQKRPFRESDRKLMTIICDALSAEMQKNKFIHFTKGFLYEEFIKDLLDKKIVDSNFIEERKEYLHLNLKQNIYVLTVDISEFDSEHNSLSFIQGVLERIIVDSKSIIYNDNIVMVASFNSQKDFIECYQEKIDEYLHSVKIRIGISRAFNNLENMREYYLQSLEALNLSQHMNRNQIFITYDDYAIYHMIEVCAQNDDIKKFCIPSLLKLIEYDHKYNTPFTKSLYTYVLCSESITESAHVLKIHRNTMIYRIDKIIEIMGADISDYETLLHIQLSFKLLEYDKSYSAVFSDIQA
ncbi:MAG: helix-turn-helix domain-containing protein, partial [Bacillota bacterium]